ncbi:MAG: SWIM zinc finger family protein [Chloroflexi bacterium]|nr:SWIM zinc finger family protein [Chloroflexota bacterium]
MDSAMISKIQKAKQYAQERDRIQFDTFSVTFQGNHNTYTVTYDHGNWSCTCRFFAQRGICSHTMALEHILQNMIEPIRLPETVV